GRADVQLDNGRAGGKIAGVFDWKAEVDLLGQVALLNEGQQPSGPPPAWRSLVRNGRVDGLAAIPTGEGTVAIVVAMQRQADLVQVVRATRTIRRLPDFLHSRKEHADQHADNGNDDQQFEQCKPPSTATSPRDRTVSHRTLASYAGRVDRLG